MINWDEVKQEWGTSKITLAALAEKHDIKHGTLKSRKSRAAWVRGAPKKMQLKRKRLQPLQRGMQLF